MNISALKKCILFRDLGEDEITEALRSASFHVRNYDKDEIVFHLMDEARRIGIILEGRVQAQKTFPNGSQVNVSVMGAGSMIGPAAVFSSAHTYPCDIVALDNVEIMMFEKDELLKLISSNQRMLNNFISEISSSIYMLQQRVELMSYSGIAQKAAFWLLMQMRRTGSAKIHLPGSMTRWALMMNVSRPSLHRELRKLESEGILSYEPPFIRVDDPEGLQEVLSV